MRRPVTRPVSPPAMGLPMLALAYNASAWGLSWWPFRALQAQGLHPLWATGLIYGFAVLLISVWRPAAWGQWRRTPALWLVALAAGTTNAAFNWGVSIGDVVRVVLMFYLMPLWAVMLAWWVLGERAGWLGGLRVALGLAGAALVLWPAQGGWPLPQALPDWLGVLGGFAFALNNVMLRREAARAQEGRALAMFLGSAVLAALVAGVIGAPAVLPDAAGIGMMAALAGVFLSSNLALQYGAARLPVSVASVVMLIEVVVAAASSVWFGGAVLTGATLLGGALILSAATLAALRPRVPGP